MNNFTHANLKPLQVAVRRGLPNLSNAPLTANLVALIQAQAEGRGQRLERIEVHPQGATSWFDVDVYWLVADMPDNLSFGSLREAHQMLGEQISRRVDGALDDTDDCPFVLFDLHWLLRLARDANERDGIMVPDAGTHTEAALPSPSLDGPTLSGA